MHYYEVAPNRIIRADSDTFTYSSSVKLYIGAIVEIEIGKKKHIGIVFVPTKRPSYDVKEILRVIEEQPVPRHLLSLAVWMSQYYKTPLAACLQTILPQGITKKRRQYTSEISSKHTKRTHFLLNDDQKQAVARLRESKGTVLLHGVTGSGKTAVYLEHARHVVANGRSVILLVPEIALTSQLVAEFSSQFSDILVTHSKQTEAERHTTWKKALLATEPRVVIGPRSALFLPMRDIGLIIIDECHEPSFQQEQSPRYSALRVASKYAELSGGLAVFGSATPLVSDYFLAEKHKKILTLPLPARADTLKPDIKIVDMTKRSNFSSHRFISTELLTTLTQTFESKKQALIFHNRRGSTTITLCEQCGWQAGCNRCFLPLTLHADRHELKCHVCGLKTSVPTSCPQCHHANIIHRGIGTKLIESELRKLFPKQTIVRFDGDSESADTVAARFDDIKSGNIDLVIGTQVVAKGLDLPHLRMVGVIQADAGLSLPDYSSSERTFQLLAQVIGRVGRSNHATTVVIQSFQPNNTVIKYGIAQDYNAFYESTLRLRKHSHFPPDRYLLKLICVYKTEAAAIKNSMAFRNKLAQVAAKDVEILGPTPAFYERASGSYRWQLVIKSPVRKHLTDIIEHLPPSHWQYELDPISLL